MPRLRYTTYSEDETWFDDGDIHEVQRSGFCSWVFVTAVYSVCFMHLESVFLSWWSVRFMEQIRKEQVHSSNTEIVRLADRVERGIGILFRRCREGLPWRRTIVNNDIKRQVRTSKEPFSAPNLIFLENLRHIFWSGWKELPSFLKFSPKQLMRNTSH